MRKEYLPFGKPNFSDKEIEAVTHVLRSGWVGMGPETIAFEKELAEFLKAPYVVTVNSCTSALFLSLLIKGIGPGDEVICPSMTWCSTANVALYLGARPVFCEVDPVSFCATPETIKSKLSDKTKAVMVVHMGGLAADVDKIRKILPEQVVIIEDAAHALGAKFDHGRPVGSSGNLTCFSFYANKNLSTGEGGAIALFEPELAEKLYSLRQHGLNSDAWKRFSHPQAALVPRLTELGYKMNYTDLQACIGRIQLKRQEDFHSVRLRIATQYVERLGALFPNVRFQQNTLHPYHARHLMQILLPVEEMNMSRDELVLQLRAHNIGASIHYEPLHLMPLYKKQQQEILPVTEDIYKRIMTLPIAASMNDDDANCVIHEFEKLLRDA